MKNLSYQTLMLEKKEILEELGNVKDKDLNDLVYRMQITCDENMDILNLKYNPTKRTGYGSNADFYEVFNLNDSLKCILPDNVKVSVTIDDVRLKSN